MSLYPRLGKIDRVTRRQLLQWGLTGLGVSGAAIAYSQMTQTQTRSVPIPPLRESDPMTMNAAFNPMQILREFDYGTIKRENGRIVREFHLEAGTSVLQLNKAVTFNSWNVNQRVPGPTLRATQGDRVRIIFTNKGGHAHSLHFHGIHRPEMDGIKPVRHNSAFVYEFDAETYGVHVYHCHIAPVTRHISKGLYGMFIIDPPKPRPPADEMVLVMGGYDTNDDNKNELYAFNGLPNYYMMNPIRIYQNQLIRLYVLNMIEYDSPATFHIHGNFFKVYRTGMSLTPAEETDVITMGVAERHILEFSYKYPGKYMFHPHQDAIAEAGCMGAFDVVSKSS